MAVHFVATLRQKMSKQNPLRAIFGKQVIGPKVFASKAGRSSWFAAQKANRKHRLAKVKG